MKGSGPVWSVGRSIALELDSALGFLRPNAPDDRLPFDAPDLRSGVAVEWKAQWSEMLGTPRPWISVLTLAARLAGVWDEADYTRATLAIRELTAEQALARLTPDLAEWSIAPDLSLPPAERLADALTRLMIALQDQIGLHPVSRESQTRSLTLEVTQAVRILRDGDLHARFWHWLDRAYYTWYQPWRESVPVIEALAVQEQRAVAALGAREGSGSPNVDWLPPQNGLNSFPELLQAVGQGRFRLFFWVQPFGLFDWWTLTPGAIMVTFGEPSYVFNEFRSRTSDLAERVKALSDPTRLAILRMIRHYAKDNTQMADYLGVARPTVSIHAKILREAGLIETQQEGRGARHTVNAAEIRRLFKELLEFLDLPEES